MSRLVVAIGHVEFTGGSQVLYVIKVQQDVEEWEVRRTYSDFRKLRDDVQRVMKDARTHILEDGCSHEFARELQNMAFPSKRLFGNKKEHVVKERAVELHHFLIKLLLLTHTYRKAQKTRYDQYVHTLPEHQQAAYTALQDRTQASITVFYLLREFLKPVKLKTNVLLHSGDLLGSPSNKGLLDRESQDSPSRMIRESKILAMRNSSTTSEQKGNTSFNEGGQAQQHDRKGQITEKLQKEQQKYQQRQQIVRAKSMIPKTGPAPTRRNDRGRSDSKTIKLADLVDASGHPRADANLLSGQVLQKQHSTPVLTNEYQKEWRYAMLKETITAATASAAVLASYDDSEPEKEKTIVPSSVPSYASSATSSEKLTLVDLSSTSRYESRKSLHKSSRSSDKAKSSQNSRSKEKNSKTRSKEKKGSSRIKRKAQPAKNVPMSDSERMSRVSLALSTQAVAISAQRELEKYLPEYSAIMVLRYVDRFINKAVMKAPGCYRVNAQHRLVIDCERFLEELSVTFTDLPHNFGDLFHTGASGDQDEWAFPPALNKYVQLKWDAFQAMGRDSTNPDNDRASAADLTSDSDDSDTEYEYEEASGGYLATKEAFSNDEESMLQEMIANGTAGREQVLRLQRQVKERSWNRRGNRSQRLIEEVSSSESDEEEDDTRQREKYRPSRYDSKKRVSGEVEKYQQEQNNRRKDRLNQVPGGFV